MNVLLRPETRELLDERLKTGRYTTAADVVHAALLALGELEGLEPDDEALDAIDRAEDQIERGECRDWAEVRAKFLGQQ